MTQKAKIIDLLKDKEWHSTEELHAICWRYGARLFDLREEGYVFEKKPHPFKKNLELWRLLTKPGEVVPEQETLI